MGRPKLPDATRRRVGVSAKLTTDEMAKLRKAAKAYGNMPLAQYIRMILAEAAR
jgi:hypothetical protein